MTHDAGLAERLADDGFGDVVELREVLPDVYADLKRIAHRQLLRRVPGATLSTTVLVHETYARLVERGGPARLTRAHFMALCARVMRQVVIDSARARQSIKRGGGDVRVEIDDTLADPGTNDATMLTFARALERLALADPRLVGLIEQHWFIGLDADELATLHGLSLRTVQRELKRARAWVWQLLSP